MSAARDHKGPWLDASVLRRLAPMRREFDLNRDPLVAKQLADANKTEKQRREESAAGGYFIPRKRHDKPEQKPQPPQSVRAAVDRAAFQSRWLAAQQEAVFARIVEPEPRQTPAQEQTHTHSISREGPSL